jgi:hypothetical protein
MPPIQTTYNDRIPEGKLGAIVNTEHSDIISRTVEGADGLGFGIPVAQGTKDKTCIALAALTLAGTAEADAGNAANTGVMTMATPSVGASGIPGAYRVIAIEPGTDAGTFIVEDPNGVQVGKATVGVAYDGPIRFTIADGSTDFKAGEGFTVTVAASEGDIKPIGFTVLDRSVRPETPNSFAQYESARLMRKGVLWVNAAGTVAAGDPVYVQSSGALSNAPGNGKVRVKGARWETSRTGAGLAQMRVNLVDID